MSTESPFGEKVDRIGQALARDYVKDEDVSHVIARPMPSEQSAQRILGLLSELMFLGYFGDQERPKRDLPGHVSGLCRGVFSLLTDEIAKSYRHECHELKKPCCLCRDRGQAQAIVFMERLGGIRKALKLDVQAAYDGDPAAKSLDEIVFSYPGLRAIAVQRLAHALYELGVPLLPRIMSEYSHRETGIDIHPGAKIGPRFFIDHGTGVVIGETSEIGENVRLYHGVTLGAFSLPADQVNELRGKKRHPTIEDNVIIYPNATVLGGDTVIGRGAVIGGNCWITESVPPRTIVSIDKPELRYKNGEPPPPSSEAKPYGDKDRCQKKCSCDSCKD